ncbi:MAG: porin family protein [Chitinophagales bacterium]
MKGILIFSVTLFCTLTSKAQVDLEIFAGPHASSASYSVKGKNQSTDYKFGFQIGGGVKIPFENKLSFVPDLSYKLMGYKVNFNTPSFPPDLLAKDNNTSFHEIDLDVLLQFDLGKNPGHFFLKAGPDFSFILAGNEKFNLLTGKQVDRSMKFSVLNSYGRYDASVVIQFGYETSEGFFVYANYVQHLISMNNEDQGPSIRNYLAGITFGKILKPKK